MAQWLNAFSVLKRGSKFSFQHPGHVTHNPSNYL